MCNEQFSTTLNEVEAVVKTWLRHAPWRFVHKQDTQTKKNLRQADVFCHYLYVPVYTTMTKRAHIISAFHVALPKVKATLCITPFPSSEPT